MKGPNSGGGHFRLGTGQEPCEPQEHAVDLVGLNSLSGNNSERKLRDFRVRPDL
jgi:hypothetical protein